jgi:hypothetical protein
MINKSLFIIFLYFAIKSLAFGENYIFETAEIEISKDENTIMAYNGK